VSSIPKLRPLPQRKVIEILKSNGFGEVRSGNLVRENLEEKTWNDPAQLSEGQIEELIQGLIDELNQYPDINATWTCSGDTLVAAHIGGVNSHESPVFFVGTIRKFLMAKNAIASAPSFAGDVRLGRLSAVGGIFINPKKS
jgi:hypothetical protein